MRKMKNKEASDQSFPLVLFIMLCKEILTFESNDKILSCASIQLKATIKQYSPVVPFILAYKVFLTCRRLLMKFIVQSGFIPF